MPSAALPRSERLRSLQAIRRLFESGRAGFVYPFRYVWLVQPPQQTTQVLFSVPKKFLKRANRRNLVRRRTKEAYRLSKGSMRPGTGHLALIYSTKEIIGYERIEEAVRRILAQIAS